MARYQTPSNRSRKRPKNAPTHVARLRLDPSPRQARTMLLRGRACDRVYNACLREALRRLESLRADEAFEKAKAMPSGTARTAAFRALDQRYGFTEWGLMSYASSLRKPNTWTRDLVGAHEAQVEGRTAFRAVKRWSLGLSGKPKFRSYYRRTVLSAECKDLTGDIRPLLSNGLVAEVRWGRNVIIPVSKPRSIDEQRELERISDLINRGALRYCRVVSRLVGNRWLHEAQFVLDGPAPLRHEVGSEEMVTIDSGPSWLHVVYDSGSRHIEIAPSVESTATELRRLQRHLDRQHRSGSPQCFDEKGNHVTGHCYWEKRSKAAEQTKARIANLYRIMAARRDSDHGRVANELLAISSYIRTEDHGTKAWQRSFLSKSVQRRGPGGQLERIERAVARAEGTYDEVDSHLALSQLCVCGERVKKPLKEQRHRCENCQLDLDRHLFSAFLMRHVRKEDGHQAVDLDAARAELISSSDGIHNVGAGGHPCDSTTKRQDLGARPDKTRSESEKRKFSNRRPPGKRSLVRIRKRHKANGASDSTARPEDGVSALQRTSHYRRQR